MLTFNRVLEDVTGETTYCDTFFLNTAGATKDPVYFRVWDKSIALFLEYELSTIGCISFNEFVFSSLIHIIYLVFSCQFCILLLFFNNLYKSLKIYHHISLYFLHTSFCTFVNGMIVFCNRLIDPTSVYLPFYILGTTPYPVRLLNGTRPFWFCGYSFIKVIITSVTKTELLQCGTIYK